jgi:hypothetical protein
MRTIAVEDVDPTLETSERDQMSPKGIDAMRFAVIKIGREPEAVPSARIAIRDRRSLDDSDG